MNTKMLGTAVGIALENREALKTASAPTVNAATGVFQVIFRTMWKSVAVNTAIMMVWMATFISVYVFGGANNFVATPGFMAVLALVVFMVTPTVIFIREIRKVSKVVAAKNQAHRVAAQKERQQREAENAQAIAAWEAHQAMQQYQQMQYQQMPYQQVPQTRQMPQMPQRQPQYQS